MENRTKIVIVEEKGNQKEVDIKNKENFIKISNSYNMLMMYEEDVHYKSFIKPQNNLEKLIQNIYKNINKNINKNNESSFTYNNLLYEEDMYNDNFQK